jgi:hypothetical protein
MLPRTGPPARYGLLALWVALVLAPVVAAESDEPLYYFVEGKGVVITNTPSRADAKPVMKPQPVDALARATTVERVVLPATRYDEFIDRIAAEAGLYPRLIKAVALVESGFDSRAVSPKGAQGLMQLMPATARAYGVTDAFDPKQNLQAGTTHLRGLLDEFGGDVTLALAAYNAGSAAVRRYGGVPNYRETKDYVKRVHAKLDLTPAVVAPRRAKRSEPVRMIRSADGSVTLSN